VYGAVGGGGDFTEKRKKKKISGALIWGGRKKKKKKETSIVLGGVGKLGWGEKKKGGLHAQVGVAQKKMNYNPE